MDSIIDFLSGYISGMIKSTYCRVTLSNGILYVMADYSVIYMIDLSNKIDRSTYMEFEFDAGKAFNVVTHKNNNEVTIKANQCLSVIHSNNMVYENPNLLEDPKFTELVFAKAGEGAGFYFINTSIYPTFIPVFNGFPALNKADTVGIRVFDIGNYKLMVNYTVYKKKFGCSYDMYFNILNVNRPLRM